MSDIFICYTEADRAIATQLGQRLRAEGWSVFMDVQTPVGRRWHREIEKELYAAKAVVALWSATSRESDFVLEEAEYGKRKEILFPAFIERVEYPYGFRRIQTADLVGWAGDMGHLGLAQLLESLKEHLNSGETATDPAVTSKPVQPPSAGTLAAGQTFRDRLKTGADGPLMVVIPSGRFLMGSPEDEPERLGHEGPQHEVRIAAPFGMGVYAVTFDDYDRFCDDTKGTKPGNGGWGREKRPVINVSWKDAQTYCDWLSQQTGRRYRLPSEAEWEYACRAGTNTPFYFGATITTEQANFDGNYTYNGSAKGKYREKTMPVGSFPPNAFGLCDTHGNVWEWCQDHWHKNYQGAPADGSAWEGGGKGPRVLRGGSWGNNPGYCRAAFRYDFYYASRPGGRDDGVGFRVCCGGPIK